MRAFGLVAVEVTTASAAGGSEIPGLEPAVAHALVEGSCARRARGGDVAKRVRAAWASHPLAVVVIGRRFIGSSLIPALVLALRGTRVIVPVPLALSSLASRLRCFRGSASATTSPAAGSSSARASSTAASERSPRACSRRRRLSAVPAPAPRARPRRGGGRSRRRARVGRALASRDLARRAERLREALLGAARLERRGGGGKPPYRATPVCSRSAGSRACATCWRPPPSSASSSTWRTTCQAGWSSGQLTLPSSARPPTLSPLPRSSSPASRSSSLPQRGCCSSTGTSRSPTRVSASPLFAVSHRRRLVDRDRIRGVEVGDTPVRRVLRLVTVTAIAAGLRGTSRWDDACARCSRLRSGERSFVLSTRPRPTLGAPRSASASRGRRRFIRALPSRSSSWASVGLRVPWAIAAAVLLVIRRCRSRSTATASWDTTSTRDGSRFARDACDGAGRARPAFGGLLRSP